MKKKHTEKIDHITDHILYEIQKTLTDRMYDLLDKYPDLIPCGGPGSTATAILNGGKSRNRDYDRPGEPEYEYVRKQVEAFMDSLGPEGTTAGIILNVFYANWEQYLIRRYIENTTGKKTIISIEKDY